MQEFDKEVPSRFGIVTGYAFTINSCIGAGFLAIPGVYQNGGWLLAFLMTAVSLILGALFSLQLFEVASRVESIKQSEESTGESMKTLSLWKIMKLGCGLEKMPESRLMDQPKPSISEYRQYDLSVLVKILLGNWWSYSYIICICLYLAGALTAYANIFGTAFGTHAPIITSCDFNTLNSISFDCRMQYLIFVSIFLVIMLYFTNIEFKEQLWMQATMTVLRIFVMLTIIVICMVNLITGKNIDNAHGFRSGDPPLGVFSQIGYTLPAILFGGVYQTQYAGIVSVIRKDPKVLRTIVLLVTITLEVFYCSLGLFGSFAINRVASNVSLSFGNYSDGNAEDGRPLWTAILGYAIVIFPALDVMSIFPIVGQAISDNILSLVHSGNRSEFRQKNRLLFHALRTVCILPSFAYAFSETHLGSIVNNAGMFTFYVIMFIVPLLHIAAKYHVPEKSDYQVKYNPPVSF